MKFEVKVRQRTTRKVVLENPSGQRWQLTPSLCHESWSAPASVDVPANGRAEYEIVYHPQRTTSAERPDAAELFLALPTGAALLFKLLGTATPPDAADTIELEAPCKKLYLKSLPVRNWLPTPQRFRVVIEADDKDPSVSIKGSICFFLICVVAKLITVYTNCHVYITRSRFYRGACTG